MNTPSNHFQEIEQRLQKELPQMEIPSPRHPFETNIFQSCLQHTNETSYHLTLWQLIEKCFSTLHLPSPAVSTALVLLFGFLAGLTTPQKNTDLKNSGRILSQYINGNTGIIP